MRTEEVVKNNNNLSPSRYVTLSNMEEVLPVKEAVVLLREVEEECRDIDQVLCGILRDLGLEGRNSG